MHRMDQGSALCVALLLTCGIVSNGAMSHFTVSNQVNMFSTGASKFFLCSDAV